MRPPPIKPLHRTNRQPNLPPRHPVHDYTWLNLRVPSASFNQPEQKVPILMPVQLIIPLHHFGGFASQNIATRLRLKPLSFEQIIWATFIRTQTASRCRAVAFTIEYAHGTETKVQFVLFDELNRILN